MPTVSVSTLIDRARATADMRDNFVTPTQWAQWASQERLALDFFLARSGWSLPLSDFDITVVGDEAGDFDVNPTGGVMAIVCVYEYDTAGRVRMLRQQDAYSFVRRIPTYGAPGDSRFYRVQWEGDSLVLNMYPTPSAGETYRVVYIAHPRPLYETEAAYTSQGVLGNLTLYNRTSGVTTDINVSLTATGTPGTNVVITAQSSSALVMTYEESATWENVRDEINSSATYVEAEITGVNEIIREGDFSGLYTATLTGGAYGAHTVAYPLGWEERIVLGMARRALMKEESDTRPVDTEIALWESRIEEACWNRVLTNSPSVRNSDQETYGWTDRFSMPPIGNWVFP